MMTKDFFDFDEKLLAAADRAEARIAGPVKRVSETAAYNQRKVLRSFIDCRVAETDLWGTTGYGYSDAGREKADEVCARALGAESALIRASFTGGTHTLTVALFGLLRPGDTMLCVTGRPYDTICPVIGMDGADGTGSLADFGVSYMQTELAPDGRIDTEEVKRVLRERKIKLVYIQRSRGYTLRPSLSAEEIGRAAREVKSVSDAIVFVDNCYGEFTEKTEPTGEGADIIVGSLIKNPGGGVARCGGYIAGKKKLVELCSYRMTAPSLGAEVGATLGTDREILMGLFHAPHITGEALKTALFASALFEELGFGASPGPEEIRHDIVQAVLLGNSENLIAFCRGLQAGSPVDSFVTPEPWDMPGYPCQVIMAAGTFTSGSSAELSGDAPLREPYAVWMQGGLNYDSAKVGVMSAAQRVIDALTQP